MHNLSEKKTLSSTAGSALGASILGATLLHLAATPAPAPGPVMPLVPYTIESTASTLGQSQGGVYGALLAEPNRSYRDTFERVAANFKLQLAEPVLDGIDHAAQPYLEEIFLRFPSRAQMWALGVVDGSDTSNAADILRLLCRFHPGNNNWRRAVVEMALASKSLELRDAAIQAVETWKEPKLISALRNHNEAEPWLSAYAQGVLADYGNLQ